MEDRDTEDRVENSETEELVEKDLSRGGQASSAGVGDIDGEGEESRVDESEGEAWIWGD